MYWSVSFEVCLTMVEVNGSESFPNATNETFFSFAICTGPYPPKAVRLTLYSILMTLSLIGNVLVIAVFCRNKTLRTAVHYFIVNMAISDLTLPVITLAWAISDAYLGGLWLVDGVLGTILCKLVWIAWGISTCVSILSLMVTAADRFHAVLFPMKSALITRKKRRMIIAAIWVASVAFQAIFLYGAKLVSNDTGIYCIIHWESASHTKEMYRINWILVFCLTTVSAIVLTVLYSSTIFFLYRYKNNLQLATEAIKRRAKTNQQITRMFVIVVVAFYLVWIPYRIVYCISIFTIGKIPCSYFFFCINFPLLYSVVNSVVYYIFNSNYRQGFRELLCCQWPCSNKYNDCFHPSASPQGESNVHYASQVNNVTENIELQEHR